MEGLIESISKEDHFKSEIGVVEPHIINNLDFYAGKSFIDFVRTYGVKFRMGPMLSRDSVK